MAPGLPDRPSREPDGTRPSSAIIATSAVAVAAASALDRRREHELSGGRRWSTSTLCARSSVSPDTPAERARCRRCHQIGTLPGGPGVCLSDARSWLLPVQPAEPVKALGAHNASRQPAGEGCRARWCRARLRASQKWCPGSDPCRSGGGTCPGGTARPHGVGIARGREGSQPLVWQMTELLTQLRL